jgi:hypothetical protein
MTAVEQPDNTATDAENKTAVRILGIVFIFNYILSNSRIGDKISKSVLYLYDFLLLLIIDLGALNVNLKK